MFIDVATLAALQLLAIQEYYSTCGFSSLNSSVDNSFVTAVLIM